MFQRFSGDGEEGLGAGHAAITGQSMLLALGCAVGDGSAGSAVTGRRLPLPPMPALRLIQLSAIPDIRLQCPSRMRRVQFY
jgi:hypothetical protein